jgi:hypothetical protein
MSRNTNFITHNASISTGYSGEPRPSYYIDGCHQIRILFKTIRHKGKHLLRNMFFF